MGVCVCARRVVRWRVWMEGGRWLLCVLSVFVLFRVLSLAPCLGMCAWEGGRWLLYVLSVFIFVSVIFLCYAAWSNRRLPTRVLCTLRLNCPPTRALALECVQRLMPKASGSASACVRFVSKAIVLDMLASSRRRLRSN